MDNTRTEQVLELVDEAIDRGLDNLNQDPTLPTRGLGILSGIRNNTEKKLPIVQWETKEVVILFILLDTFDYKEEDYADLYEEINESLN